MTYQKTKKINFIVIIFSICFYVLYVTMSDIYPILPPLIGVMFMMFYKYYKNEQFSICILIMLCLFFYELDKSLIVGIMPCVFFITYWFITKQFEYILHINLLFVIIYVSALYLLYVVGMVLCNALFKTSILDFSFIYIYYFIIDCIVSLIYYYIFIRE